MSRKKRRQQRAESPSVKKDRSQPKREVSSSSPWIISLAAVIVISTLSTIIYSNTYDVPFLFDDENNIVNNQQIRVTEFEVDQFYNAAMHSRAPRPVAYFSFALNYYFDGYNVWGYHFVNNAIHLLSGVLVFFLASVTYRLSLRGNCGKLDTASPRLVGWLSLFAACIFVAHPLQTQAVTYLVQRMTSLSTLFYLLAFLLYIYGRLSTTKQTRWVWWGCCLIAGILSMGSKQIAITLPVIIFLYDWFFFRDLDKQWAKNSAKYLLAIGLVIGGVSLIFLGTSPWEHLLKGYEIRDFTMGERVLTQFRVVMLYLGLVILPLPSRLSLFHDLPTSHSLFDPLTTVLSIIAILSLVGLGIRLARQQRLVSFGILWFFINLVLESSIISLEMVYEHRIYLPMFGIALLVPYLLQKLLSKQTALAAVIAILITIGLSRGTYVRNETWRDDFTFWTDVITKSPTSHRAHDSIGNIYWRQGKSDLAIANFTKAIELKPDYAVSYNNRANSYSELKKFPLALQDYAKAIEHDPEYATAYANRGSVYGESGKYDLAAQDYAKAIELKPKYTPAYYNRSLVYSRMNDYESALADINTAIELNPGEATLHLARARYAEKLRDFKLAIADYTKAIELTPDMLPALKNLAWLLATSPEANNRNAEQALQYAQKAYELTKGKDSGSVEALAAAYAESGNFSEAVQWQSKAVEMASAKQNPIALQRMKLYLSKQPYHQTTKKVN